MAKQPVSDKKKKASRENGKKGGRPKGSLSDEQRMRLEMKRLLVEKVREQFDQLFGALMDLAKGHILEGVDKEGNERTYIKGPHAESLKYLLDQVVGKAESTVNLNTDKDRVTLEDLLAAANGDVEIVEKKKKKGRK